MTDDWRATSRTADSRRALARLAAVEPDVAALGVVDLGDLVALLGLAAGPTERNRAARIFQAMVRSQHVHPLVPRATLQAVLPGLVTVARRLAWGAGGDWESGGVFFVDAVTTAWEVIVGWSGQDRDYAVLDLLSAVRCRLRRQLLRQRSGRDRVVVGVDLDTVPRPPCSSGTADLDELARAIDGLTGRGVDPLDAAVLYGNQVLGLSLTELARMAGTSRRRVVGRRDRAARELFA